MSELEPISAALEYTRLGWRVFPVHSVIFGAGNAVLCDCGNPSNCDRKGKHPRLASWQTQATTDEQAIRAWWLEWPTANVGLATGAGSGVWALDVDPAKGGDESLASLERDHGRLPQSVEAITGSGGRHLLYRWPGVPLTNRQNVRPGLDVRGEGGYIVVAPSVHASGRRYEWEATGHPSRVALTDAPAWLLELVTTRPEPVTTPLPAIAIDDLPPVERRLARAEGYLRGIPGAISGQSGHAQAWQAALVLVRGFALPGSDALDLLMRDYNPRCEPPWNRRELEHKVRSAANDGRRPLGYLLARPADAPPSPDDYDAEERKGIKEESAQPEHRWITPVERALAIGTVGTRLPTGIQKLDEATRGGPLTGRLIAIGGAPGAGKTGFCVQLARHYSQAGHHVAILAADEEADGLLIRWGQLEGIRREEIEEGSPAARQALAERMAEYPKLLLVDGDEDPATIERVAKDLADRAQGEPAILFVDSIQMARASGTEESKNPRERTDVVVRALKRAAKRLGLLIIATSELSRGAYRAKQSKDNINSLAAFKESGGIEYGVTTALVMIAVPGDEDGLVDVGIPKNRLGKKLEFRLKQNFRLCQFVEVDPETVGADAEEDEDPEELESRRIDKARTRLLEAIKHVSLAHKTALCKRARGRYKDNVKAFDELQLEGIIGTVDGVIRVINRGVN